MVYGGNLPAGEAVGRQSGLLAASPLPERPAALAISLQSSRLGQQGCRAAGTSATGCTSTLFGFGNCQYSDPMLRQ